jgi:hypothetical protein
VGQGIGVGCGGRDGEGGSREYDCKAHSSRGYGQHIGPELVMVGRKEWEWGKDCVGWVIYMFCGVTKFRFGRVSVHSRAKSN